MFDVDRLLLVWFEVGTGFSMESPAGVRALLELPVVRKLDMRLVKTFFSAAVV